jgi:plasmid stabilization system protein ParE
LHAFLDPKNPDAARRAAQIIIKATELLADNPHIGTVVEDMIDDGEYRDLHIPFGSYGYLLRFRYEHDTVYILHINHSKEESFHKIPRA